MVEVIHDRKAAIRNTTVYAAITVLALAVLLTRSSWTGRGVMAVVLVWAVGGLKANWRAVRHGFELDDER